jgi:hypothetical protein
MSTIINATTTNGVVIQPDNSGSLVLQTNSGTTALTIDTSQNVGIGTTPSSSQWSGTKALQLGATAYISGRTSSASGVINISNNAFLNSTPAWQYITTNGCAIYEQSNDVHIWNNAPSGTAGTTFTPTERMRIDSAGALILAGSTAQKASGTTWSNPSDQRLKDNIRDYTKGTTELMQVRVREWEYNGKGGTTEGLKGLGVVADEVMTILPNTVETYDAKLNAEDEETTEIKKFDATEITWLLVKTVQEQQTIINDLKARVETLEAK